MRIHAGHVHSQHRCRRTGMILGTTSYRPWSHFRVETVKFFEIFPACLGQSLGCLPEGMRQPGQTTNHDARLVRVPRIVVNKFVVQVATIFPILAPCPPYYVVTSYKSVALERRGRMAYHGRHGKAPGRVPCSRKFPPPPEHHVVNEQMDPRNRANSARCVCMFTATEKTDPSTALPHPKAHDESRLCTVPSHSRVV